MAEVRNIKHLDLTRHAPPIQTKVTLDFQELELVDKRRFNNTKATEHIKWI